jgi:hypothetical protein
MCCLFKGALSYSHYIASDDRMGKNVERTWKEAAITKFTALSRHLPGGIKEIHKKSVMIAGFRLIYEPGTSKIRNSVNDSATTFGQKILTENKYWHSLRLHFNSTKTTPNKTQNARVSC